MIGWLQEHPEGALVVSVLNPKLDRIDARKESSFGDGEFAREVLLVLARRAQAVVAKADVNG